MSRVKPWVNALKVKFQDYEEWTTQVAGDRSITYWALDKGKLRAQDYLQWAREYYQIPVINDGYFREEANGELYLKMIGVANWSPEMLPLFEWEGVVYIACVEPPLEVKWSFPVQYVLASARSLKQFWGKLQAEPTKQATMAMGPEHPSSLPMAKPDISSLPDAPPTMSEDIPEGLSFHSGDVPTDPAADSLHTFGEDGPEGLDSFSTNSHLEASEFSSIRAPSGVAPEMPEGMSFDVATDIQPESPPEVDIQTSTPELLESNQPFSDPVNIQPSTHEPDVESAPAFFETEKSLDRDEPIENLYADKAETPQKVEEFVAPSGLKQKEELKPSKISHPSGPGKASLAPKPKPPPPIPENLKANSGDQLAKEALSHGATRPVQPELNQVSKGREPFTGLNKDASADGAIDIDKDLPINIDSATNQVQIIAWTFNELKQSFSTSMVLCFEGEFLKPWKWESIWTPKSEIALAAFDISRPGIFRIVARTKHSYHGFLVGSPANQDFFELWGYRDLPKHVTVVPFMGNEEIKGMILSVGEETSNTESNLILAERTAAEMAVRLRDLKQKAA